MHISVNCPLQRQLLLSSLPHRFSPYIARELQKVSLSAVKQRPCGTGLEHSGGKEDVDRASPGVRPSDG